MDLNQQQEIIWHLITAPKGVADGLRTLPRAGHHLVRLEDLVLPNSRLTAVQRLDIYANMYFHRIFDCLVDDFPGVVGVIGRTHFNNLITDYLIKHPSTSYSLNDVPKHLEVFTRHHALQRKFPCLADMVAFEWAIIQSFFAPEVPLLTRADLERLPAEAWPTMKFTLAEHVRVLKLAYAVRETLELAKAQGAVSANEKTANGKTAAPVTATERESIPPPQKRPVGVLVYRQDGKPYHRYLAALEIAALKGFRSGFTFGRICENVATIYDGTVPAAQVLASILLRLVEEGVLLRTASVNHNTRLG